MQLSSNGFALIQSFEGLVLHPYRDVAGIPTIGYGTTHYEDGTPVTMADAVITKERADQLMLNDLRSFEASIQHMVMRIITQNQYDALVSFVYNIGVNNFRTSTLLKLVNSGNPIGAASEFSKWDIADGKHNIGLLQRRMKEEQLFCM